MLAKLKMEIEGYDLLDRLGEGGQATVYKAIQKKDNRLVAIKVLHAGPHASTEARARLRRETMALRAIEHPNIVHAIGAGRTRSGLECLVMNFIDGKPLDTLWEDSTFSASIAPEPADRLRLFKRICEVVQAAHLKGITHRDLSPSNILLDSKGEPFILDFGMASTAFDDLVGPARDISITGQFIGKVKYASPEQALGTLDAIDIRSDVYALGVMLYQILTGGAFPYEVVGNALEVLNNIIHSVPRKPSDLLAQLDGAAAPVGPHTASRSSLQGDFALRRNPPLVNEMIEAIVMKSLEKRPEQRYQSAGELAADIDRYLSGRPTSASLHTSPQQSRQRATRSQWRNRVILTTAVLAATGGVLMSMKAVGAWLGISAFAIGGLSPTESLAPASVVRMESFNQPGESDPGDKRLSRLAEELAGVDAKLAAAQKRLEAITMTDADGGQPPLDYAAYVSANTQYAASNGCPISVTLISEEEYQKLLQQARDRVSKETAKDALLKERGELEVLQQSLWARLAWLMFLSRDENRIYKYELKSPAVPDLEHRLDLLARQRVMSTGVRARRVLDAALRAGVSSFAGAGASVELGKVLADVAATCESAVAALKQAARDAKDTPGLTEDDRTLASDVGSIAGSIAEAISESQQSCARASNDRLTVSMTTSRRHLQQDLTDLGAAVARLDQKLVETAKQWQLDIDATNKLPNLELGPRISTKPRPDGEGATSNDPAVNELLAPGGEWTGEFIADAGKAPVKFNGSLLPESDGHYSVQWSDERGHWIAVLKVVNEQVTMVSCRGLDAGKNTPDVILVEPVNVGGTLLRAANLVTLQLAGKWKIREGGGETVTRTIVWVIKRPVATVQVKQLTVGSQVTGVFVGDGSSHDASGNVQFINGGCLVIRVKASNWTRDIAMDRVGNSLKVTSVKYVAGRNHASLENLQIAGRITGDTIRLAGTWIVDPKRKRKGPDTLERVSIELTIK